MTPASSHRTSVVVEALRCVTASDTLIRNRRRIGGDSLYLAPRQARLAPVGAELSALDHVGTVDGRTPSTAAAGSWVIASAGCT
jgi:hypothetical protein